MPRRHFRPFRYFKNKRLTLTTFGQNAKDTKDYIKLCEACQLNDKPISTRKKAPLMTVPLMSEAFSKINIDAYVVLCLCYRREINILLQPYA